MALSDWELWACAHQQIAQFGPDALLTGGDLEGHRIWVVIVDRIEELSIKGAGRTQH